MKIFISHSSKDKWAARRISEDLKNIGAETFLDEKDISTGQSIDVSIRTNLKTSDHFLILISPSSVKSEWVLLELGGALMLEKLIIPILLYVGANEIPQAINLTLARDINDIDKYYNEITYSISGKNIEPRVINNRKSKFKVGDKVKITSIIPEDVYREEGLIADWEEKMNPYLGQITTIRGDYEDGSYLLDIDKDTTGKGYVYAEEWLTKL